MKQRLCLFLLIFPAMVQAQGLTLPAQEERPRLRAVQDPAQDFQLALRYFAGEGVKQDQAKGLEYLKLAAEGGHLEAQFNLGNYHNLFTGDQREAVRWWRLAGLREHAEALYNLGQLIDARPEFAEKDESANGLIERAAKLGSAQAKASLLEREAAKLALVAPKPRPESRAVVAKNNDDALDVPAPEPVGEIRGRSDTALRLSTDLGGQAVLSAQKVVESWQSVPDSFYSLQLFASESREAVVALVHRQRVSHPQAVLAFERAGKRWYALLYGNFSDKSAARQAASDLPLSLRTEKPWPRRLGDVRGLPGALLEEIHAGR